MDQIATTISVIVTTAETVNDTDAFDTTSSFASTGMTASHETTTNAASLESASESLTTAVDLYTSDYFTTVASFSAMIRTVEEDESGPTYAATTANPIHTDMKRTTTADVTTITEPPTTNAGETTANGKLKTFTETTRVVAPTAETLMISDGFTAASSVVSTDMTSHKTTEATIETASEILTSEIGLYETDYSVNDFPFIFTEDGTSAAIVATTAHANPTTVGRITTAGATTITENTTTTNVGKTTANTNMDQIATTISVISTAAETVSDTGVFDTTSSFVSTDMTASHETTTNAASLENESEIIGTEVGLYTPDYFTTVASFSGIVRTVEEHEASATYAATTANRITTTVERLDYSADPIATEKNFRKCKHGSICCSNHGYSYCL